MAAKDPVERAWAIMKETMFCMFVTQRGGEIRARPMSASVRPEEHAIYFFTDQSAEKIAEIAAHPKVSLMFASPGGQDYAHVVGIASVSVDRQKIRELWTAASKAWWDGPEDPAIRLVTVIPEKAEYWDGPGTVAAYAMMLKTAVFGSKPEVGDNRSVRL